ELGEDVNLRIAFNSNCKEAYFDITGNSFIGFGNFAIIFGKDDDLQEESDLSMESGMTHRTIFSVGRCIGDSDLSKSGEAKWTTEVRIRSEGKRLLCNGVDCRGLPRLCT